MELFICGNPRLLSGGKPARTLNYAEPPVTVEHAPGHMAETPTLPEGNPLYAVQELSQKLHCGKVSYHNTPAYNVFLRDGEWPSAGIELETHLQEFSPGFARLTVDDLQSNWFHFERDGSLDRAHSGEYGYELITEPLPPRAYRDQRLWIGLQNLCAPYLQSFQCKETGLHVHVGLNQFEKFDAIPLANRSDRRCIGKMLATVVYYCVVDQAFIDRVALRRQTSYCGLADLPEFVQATTLVQAGKATGAALVDYCVKALIEHHKQWGAVAEAMLRDMRTECAPATSWLKDQYFTGGHSTEVNQEHRYTIEFRRAKGTMHALSIHRIVELMTSIVRFAGKLCREPDFVATRESFMDWLIQTTTSEALRSLAKQTKG